MMESINIMQWLMALVPVITVLVLMMFLHWSGGKAGSFSWILASIISIIVFGANLKLLAFASLKGLWTTVFILYIIWGAMALFNIVDNIDGFKVIADRFTRLTGGDKLLQLLVVGWGLTSFIQGVTGFGTPIAVAALLLVGLGFSPVIATAASLMGHAWAVTFGSLGSSYGVLVKLTSLDPSGLAFWSSLFLGISCVITGLSISFLYDGWKGLKHGLPAVLVMGISMGATLIITENFILPYIESLVAGTVGMLLGAFVLPKMRWYNSSAKSSKADLDEIDINVSKAKEKNDSESKDSESKENDNLKSGENEGQNVGFHTAFTPYYILLTLVFIIYLSPLKDILAQVQISFSFPRTATSLGFVNKAVESYSPISILTTPGTLIFLSAIMSILFYKYKGLWKKEYSKGIMSSIASQALPSTITVMTMSMMSVVMMEAGMINLLARGTAMMAESIYPIVAPFIGILGAFMTGSNTSSNILFSAFQRDVAEIIGINSLIIASLQTTGGALGKIIAPSGIALGTAVTSIVGREGEIIKKTIGYTIVMGLIVGITAYVII